MVSVVMSVHNGARFLDAAITSIATQKLQDLELLIVDDGSTDGSAAIAEGHARADARIRLLASPSRGLAAALNAGLAAAGGRYVARMDADDIAYTERLARQVAYLDSHPSVLALGTARRLIAPDGRALKIVRPPTAPAAVRAALARGNCLAHPTVMLRRDAVLRVGGYRQAFVPAEDYDLWLRLAAHGDLANLAEVCLDYRVHAGQASFARLEAQVAAELAARREATTGSRRPAAAKGGGGPGHDPAGEAQADRQWTSRQIVRRSLAGARLLRRIGDNGPSRALLALASRHRHTAATGWRDRIVFRLLQLKAYL